MNKLKKHFGCYKFFQREIFAAIGVFFLCSRCAKNALIINIILIFLVYFTGKIVSKC